MPGTRRTCHATRLLAYMWKNAVTSMLGAIALGACSSSSGGHNGAVGGTTSQTGGTSSGGVSATGGVSSGGVSGSGGSAGVLDAGKDAPIDAPYFPPPWDGGDKAAQCADQFGAALTDSYGRVDGTVLALVDPSDTQCP